MEPGMTETPANQSLDGASEVALLDTKGERALRAGGFLLGAFLVAAALRFGNPGVPDPDSFYHFRHAALYAEKGLSMSAFPWLVHSIISRFASDIGYGFHVFLIPFTLLGDPVFGIKLAAVCETWIIMVLVYWVLRRHAIAYAAAWPFMLIFLSGPIVWTVLQTRPQTLTMGFSALLLSFMLLGSPWGVFAASFLISFVHLNIFPIIPVIVAVAALFKGLVERQWEWRKWALALAGVGVGWLLRPNPFGSARLEYVQILVHEVVRQKKIPLLFGREWEPVSLASLGAFSYFMLVWVGVAALAVIALAMRRRGLGRRESVFLWSSLALALAFFVVTVTITKRATPFWGTFAVMFVAQAFNCFLNPADEREEQPFKKDTRLLLALGVGVVFAAMLWDGANQHLIQRQWSGIPPARMQGAGQWLREHGKPGDIVYNVNWDAFPELFFWDTDQRYVQGLDPVFLYAYDERLYWKAHHLQQGEAADHTWGTMDYEADAQEDTYTVLSRDFGASFVILEKRRNEALYQWMLGDTRFAPGFENDTTAVFSLRSP
jgi:hypothetical protein